MEQENLEFLQRNVLFYKGFGQDLYGKLQENMKNGLEKFTLEKPIQFKEMNKEGYDYKLDFRYSKKDDKERYFRTKMVVTSKDNPEKTFSFYMTNTDAIAAKVAANFLEGKAIFRKGKDEAGIDYANWHQFQKNEQGKYEEKIYYKSHGYEPMTALKEMPYGRDVTPEQLTAYERSVRRGDDLNLMLDIEGKKDKYSLRANLEAGTLDVYDKKNKLVMQQPALSEEAKQKKEQENKQEQPAATMKTAAKATKAKAATANKVTRKPPRKTTQVQSAARSKSKKR